MYKLECNSSFPFLTTLEHNSETYYGMMKIKSKQYTTIYCLKDMRLDEILLLLEYGKQWWHQSNRMIPISLFMREEMEKFEKYAVRFNTDSVNFISGPIISLTDLPTKRIKRRNTTLKKKK